MVKRRIRTSGKKKDKSKSNALKFLVMIILIGVILYVLIGRNNQVSLVQGFRYDSNASLLVENGKIVVVYVGAEWCPYCAAERWALVDALLNFGSWSNLQPIYSAPASIEPQLPNIPSVTFINASYHSDYVIFMPVELQDRYMRPLQQMNQIQSELINKYDPQISIPFISIGGLYYRIGSGVDPTLLKGLTVEQVQKALASKNGPIYQAVHEESQAIVKIINSLLEKRSMFLYLPYLIDVLQVSVSELSGQERMFFVSKLLKNLIGVI